jgi:transposase InsO family protein
MTPGPRAQATGNFGTSLLSVACHFQVLHEPLRLRGRAHLGVQPPGRLDLLPRRRRIPAELRQARTAFVYFGLVGPRTGLFDQLLSPDTRMGGSVAAARRCRSHTRAYHGQSLSHSSPTASRSRHSAWLALISSSPLTSMHSLSGRVVVVTTRVVVVVTDVVVVPGVVIGLSLADHMRASLVCDALKMAVATRGGNVEGVVFHSDRGSQYTSAEFRELCEVYGVKQSMGKTGVCWDNALAESFFATYKLELIELRSWPTRAHARTATVHWIEAIYNRQRRHSAIDMQSPVDYEDRYWNRRAAA